MRRIHPSLAMLAVGVLFVAVSSGGTHAVPAIAERRSSEARLTALGREIFHDRTLSLRRNQSCASCHDPAWGFSSPSADVNAHGAVVAGSVPTRFGTRKPPSAAYAAHSPVLHLDEADSAWVGGGFWDGRATGRRLGTPAAEQAQLPLVNPAEQALPDEGCAVYRVTRGSYGALATAVMGQRTSAIRFPSGTEQLCGREGTRLALTAVDRARVRDAYDAIGRALAAFERSDEVSPFSSKYDAFVAGRATLTDEERRGLSLYEGKGKCAACHPNAGDRALFTDFTFDNLGVPANPENPALRGDSAWRDPGLGAVLGDSSLHGAVKVPTLRNVNRRGVAGATKAYMHNGAFKSLEQVVHFYNTRDVLPSCDWVRHPSVGRNCWPAPEVRENVNRDELGNLGLTPREERAIVAFLRTLDDGFGK